MEDTTQPRSIERLLSVPTHPETGAGDGNRETWAQGATRGPEGTTGGNAQFRLDIGAGGGDSHLALLVEFDNGPDEAPDRVWEYIDVTTLLEEWVSGICDKRAADLAQLAWLDSFDEDERVDDLEHTDAVTERAIEAAQDGAL